MVGMNPTMDTPPDLPALLQENLAAFHGFARRRTGDEQAAADAVQESLLRALKSGDRLKHGENLTAWFYRILRNVLTDLHRRNASRERAMERYAAEVEREVSRDVEETACRCFKALLPALKPEYGEALRRIDLEGEAPESAARALGITRGNLNVRLHRGRRQLRERLEQTCRLCAAHGCLDCTCNPANS